MEGARERGREGEGEGGGGGGGGESRGRANMVHVTQLRPDSGPSFQMKVCQTFKVVLSSFESGPTNIGINSGGFPLRTFSSSFVFPSSLELGDTQGL